MSKNSNIFLIQIITLVLFALLCSAILFALGKWQFNRMHWKQNLRNTINIAITQSPQRIVDIKDEDINYRKIKLTNYSINTLTKPILLYSYRNSHLGYNKILLLKDSDSNQNILFETEWRDANIQDIQQDESLIKHGKELEGIAYNIRKNKFWFIKNNLTKNRWYYLNNADINLYFPNQKIESYAILQKESILQNLNGVSVKHHLGYAIMWVILGCISSIIFSIKIYQHYKSFNANGLK